MNINFMIRGFVRQFVNRGIRGGINRYAQGGKSRDDMSMDEKRQATATRDQMQNGRRMFNMARRFMR